jgi:hypothetical protein
MRTVVLFMITDVSKLVYYGSFHSIMSFGVIFLGDSTEGKRLFTTPTKRKLLEKWQMHRKEN